MIKVLHINSNYLSTTLHDNLVNELKEIGIESVVYTATHNKNLAVIPIKNHMIVSECFRKNDRFFFYYKHNKILKDLLEKVDCNSYRLVHAHTLFTDGTLALKLKRLHNIPYVVAVRSTDVNVFFKYMFFLRKKGVEVLLNASQIIFLSETYQSFVINRYVPKALRQAVLAKSKVIPNGIDSFWHNNIYHAREALAPGKPVHIITSGLICQRKNQIAVCKAVQRLIEDQMDVSYTIIGQNKNETYFRRVTSYLFVTHIPFLPKEELIKEYRKADIFVMPSLAETFGLVYAEAMTQGLPVIYSAGQGFDGRFEEGVVGYHANSTNAAEIAQRIVDVCKNYSNISQTCMERAGKFDWTVIAKEYLSIYRCIHVKRGQA